MRCIGLGLEFLSRHATIFLAVGVLSGLVMPDLAHLLRPMLGLIVLFNLVAALVRLNFSEVVGFRRRPLLLLIVLLFVLILSPIALASILNATVQFTSLSLGLVTALVLMAAAPPITSARGWWSSWGTPVVARSRQRWSTLPASYCHRI